MTRRRFNLSSDDLEAGWSPEQERAYSEGAQQIERLKSPLPQRATMRLHVPPGRGGNGWLGYVAAFTIALVVSVSVVWLMGPNPDAMRRAYVNGRRAGEAGIAPEANPMPRGELASEWLAGWLHGDRNREGE